MGMEGEEPACTPATFKVMARKYFPAYMLRGLPRGATVDNFQWDGGDYTVVRSSDSEPELEPCTCELVFWSTICKLK